VSARQFLIARKIYITPLPTTRDGFRESIIRLGVKVDNGLEKLNQVLKKAEKVKNSDQTSGTNLRARYTLTTARGAR
jgi:hypothetical protein